MTTFQEVAAYIGGATETEVSALFGLLKSRRRTISEVAAVENLSTIKLGDRAMLKGLSPKYLNGLTGFVVPNTLGKATTIAVKLDEGQYTGKYRSPILNVPASCVRVIPKED